MKNKSLFISNLHHFCGQTDGTYKFPNSCEGDLLKQAKKEIDAAQTLQNRLVAALKLARGYMPGTIKTRDCGQCERCGGRTSSGMDKVCAECVHEEIKALLNEIEGIV